ncbi:hypothetical protein JXJ21_23785 [candidate division KSB1 bacterium]|nr:hypothetical protein [candidate division KSB1 bacterium]
MISEAAQTRVLDEIDEARYESLRRGIIILKGPFQAGKSLVLNRYLEWHHLNKNEVLINVNLYLLERLKKDHADSKPQLSSLAKLKSRARNLFSKYLNECFELHFQHHDLLVLDAVEIAFKYDINLVRLVYPYSRDGNITLISMPDDETGGFSFNWTYGLTKIINLASR